MVDSRKRLRREFETVDGMIRIYCRGRHGSDHLRCPECSALRDYASRRLERCPYGEAKPTCANCPIHCYQPKIRQQMREVMRYAGPRMFWRHPVLTVRHWLDGRREAPSRAGGAPGPGEAPG